MKQDVEAVILLECLNEDCLAQTRVEVFTDDAKLLYTKCLICGCDTYVLRAWYKDK